MMAFNLQDVLVTLAAFGAAAVFARRFLVHRKNSGAKATCASCASGDPCGTAPGETSEPEVRPMVLVRKPSKSSVRL